MRWPYAKSDPPPVESSLKRPDTPEADETQRWNAYCAMMRRTGHGDQLPFPDESRELNSGPTLLSTYQRFQAEPRDVPPNPVYPSREAEDPRPPEATATVRPTDPEETSPRRKAPIAAVLAVVLACAVGVGLYAERNRIGSGAPVASMSLAQSSAPSAASAQPPRYVEMTPVAAAPGPAPLEPSTTDPTSVREPALRATHPAHVWRAPARRGVARVSHHGVLQRLFPARRFAASGRREWADRRLSEYRARQAEYRRQLRSYERAMSRYDRSRQGSSG